MNRFWSIFLILLMVSCNATEDLNTEQQEDIVTYLTSKHSPKLLSQSDAEESLEENPEFYFESGYTTYMYIQDYYNADRETKAEIKKGSQIEITFAMYDFDNQTTPSLSTLLYTNDSTMSVYLEEMGLNIQFWTFEPLSLTIGEGALFGRIETMLIGCREGDVVEFYMTLDEAYGQSIVGLSTVEAPLAFFCEILNVAN